MIHIQDKCTEESVRCYRILEAVTLSESLFIQFTDSWGDQYKRKTEQRASQIDQNCRIASSAVFFGNDTINDPSAEYDPHQKWKNKEADMTDTIGAFYHEHNVSAKALKSIGCGVEYGIDVI